MCPLLPAIALLFLAPQPELAAADAVSRLIQQLGSNSFHERETATKKLLALGEPALDALHRTALASPDLEVKRRVERIVRVIELRLHKEESKHLLGPWHAVELEQDGKVVPRGEFVWNIRFEEDRVFWGPVNSFVSAGVGYRFCF